MYPILGLPRFSLNRILPTRCEAIPVQAFSFLFCFSLVDNDNTPSSRRQVRACGLLFCLVTAVRKKWIGFSCPWLKKGGVGNAVTVVLCFLDVIDG